VRRPPTPEEYDMSDHQTPREYLLQLCGNEVAASELEALILSGRTSFDDIVDNFDYSHLVIDICEAISWCQVLAPEEFADRLRDLLISPLNPDHIAQREMEIGPAIVSQHVPPVVIGNLAKAKRCFALGLPEAAVVFCRCILETSLDSVLTKARRTPSFPSLNSLIAAAGRHDFLSDELVEMAHAVRIRANEVLHSTTGELSLEEAKETLLQTWRIIEQLYG
jgi:hypothetical protein